MHYKIYYSFICLFFIQAISLTMETGYINKKKEEITEIGFKNIKKIIEATVNIATIELDEKQLHATGIVEKISHTVFADIKNFGYGDKSIPQDILIEIIINAMVIHGIDKSNQAKLNAIVIEQSNEYINSNSCTCTEWKKLSENALKSGEITKEESEYMQGFCIVHDIKTEKETIKLDYESLKIIIDDYIKKNKIDSSNFQSKIQQLFSLIKVNGLEELRNIKNQNQESILQYILKQTSINKYKTERYLDISNTLMCYFNKANENHTNSKEEITSASHNECPICFEAFTINDNNTTNGRVNLNCLHLTCKSCFAKITECPLCRGPRV